MGVAAMSEGDSDTTLSPHRFIGIRMVPTQDASLAGRRIEKITAISLRHIDGITLGRGAGTPSTPPSSEPG